MENVSVSSSKTHVVEEVIQAPKRFSQWCFEELHWLGRVVISSADRFYWDNGFSKAASLAYTTLLSLVPAIALAFGIFSSFAASSQYVSDARIMIFQQFVPDPDTVQAIVTALNGFSENMASLNALVILFLVLTSILLLNSIEYALNEVWQVYQPRTIAHRVQIFCAIILIIPVLVISGFYFVRLRVEPYLLNLPAADLIQTIYKYTFPFLIDFSAFASLYYLVPKAPVRFRSAVFGAFLAALLFTFAKATFAYYIEEISSYSKVYGTVAAIPIFLFWLYLAWSIVLLGVEACFQAQYLPRKGKLWKRSIMTMGDGQLLLATQALVMITRAFSDGSKLPSELEIAERLGCSTVLLKPALDGLLQAGIVTRGESRDQPITLQRSPEKVTLEEIREAVFRGRSAIHFPAQMATLFRAFAAESKSPVTTLADIVSEQER
ncbi:MAG: YihY family inner membrane protein [Oligoflexia bacterium]|nr:YihY family inner membrane protein [Oligoflexia bacterium]